GSRTIPTITLEAAMADEDEVMRHRTKQEGEDLGLVEKAVDVPLKQRPRDHHFDRTTDRRFFAFFEKTQLMANLGNHLAVLGILEWNHHETIIRHFVLHL
ncbi:MAG: hypothetical protein WC284_18735, partial [Candidimonas sp.]